MSGFLTAQTLIQCPILEVFEYVTDPDLLPQWVPLYTQVKPLKQTQPGCLTRGDSFEATLGFFTNMFGNVFEGMQQSPLVFGPKVTVYVDDLVHGRRVAYRSNQGWTTLCDFESRNGETLLTMTQSLWSLPGLFATYFIGPMQAFYNDIYREILNGLKRRLEGRSVERQPKIFFSYRREIAGHVGGRIYDALTTEFGRGVVFRDTDSLLAGGYWQDDIKSAIRQCDVVVVHIGDQWEDKIKARLEAGNYDGLRDELEAALQVPEEARPHIVPVFTMENREATVSSRMKNIADELKPHAAELKTIYDEFTGRRQALRVRADPDFRHDLEGMLRAVWARFRLEPTTHGSRL